MQSNNRNKNCKKYNKNMSLLRIAKKVDLYSSHHKEKKNWNDV